MMAIQVSHLFGKKSDRMSFPCSGVMGEVDQEFAADVVMMPALPCSETPNVGVPKLINRYLCIC